MLDHAHRGNKQSMLHEEGWNSDKEEVLNQLEALNDDVLSVDTDLLAKLRAEKMASQQPVRGVSVFKVGVSGPRNVQCSANFDRSARIVLFDLENTTPFIFFHMDSSQHGQ